MSLHDVAARGDRLATLEALRQKVAASIDAAEPENVASLAKQLQAVLAEIDELHSRAPQEADPLDEITKRRAARQPAATDRDGAASGDVVRSRRRRSGGVGGAAS